MPVDAPSYPRFIKAEVNLLRLPLFALQTRGLRQLDGFECRGTLLRNSETHRYVWRVTRHATRPFPGQLARAAHLAFLSILTESGRPLQNPVTWSWRDLCRRIGISPSGRTVSRLKEAIRATAGVIIESSRAIYSKRADGIVEIAEDDRHIYSRLQFYSKGRSDEEDGNQNAVWLAGWYLDNLQGLYTAPLDHDLWRYLDRRSPIASRLYEYLLPSLYRPTPHLTIGYPLLAQSLPVRPERYYSDARRQIGPALSLLTQTDLLAKADWRKKEGSVAQLRLHRGDRLPTSDPGTTDQSQQTFQTFEVRQIRNTKPPEAQLVAQFHRCRWGREPFRASPKELALARNLIDRYGLKKAKALIPMLANLLKQHWPEGKTFVAVDRYIPEASETYDSQRRQEANRRASAARRDRLEQEARQEQIQRRQLETTWQPIWNELPRGEQAEIREFLLSGNPALKKLPGVWHLKCLQELRRRKRGVSRTADSDDKGSGEQSAS